MIQMRMGMDDADDIQAQRVDSRQYPFRVAARIHNNGSPGQRIGNEGAIALQRTDGKGFTTQRMACLGHLDASGSAIFKNSPC